MTKNWHTHNGICFIKLCVPNPTSFHLEEVSFYVIKS